MTTLTLRYIKGDFVVTGPDIQPAKFKSRREGKASAEMFSAARTASVQPSGWAAMSSSARRRMLGTRLCRVPLIP
jgi:hypothetical protein